MSVHLSAINPGTSNLSPYNVSLDESGAFRRLSLLRAGAVRGGRRYRLRLHQLGPSNSSDSIAHQGIVVVAAAIVDAAVADTFMHNCLKRRFRLSCILLKI